MSANDTTTTVISQALHTAADTVTNADRQPRKSRTSKPKGSTHNVTPFTSNDVSLSQVVQRVAAARRIDSTKAGKLVRSHIRGNFDSYAAGKGNTPKWGALAKAKENKDGNRYPGMPSSVANAIVKRMSSKAGA